VLGWILGCMACLSDESQVGLPEVYAQAGQQASAEHQLGSPLIPSAYLHLCIFLPVQSLHQTEYPDIIWLLGRAGKNERKVSYTSLQVARPGWRLAYDRDHVGRRPEVHSSVQHVLTAEGKASKNSSSTAFCSASNSGLGLRSAASLISATRASHAEVSHRSCRMRAL